MSDKPLPPIEESSFDGEKESTEIKFVKCEHELVAVSANEVKCVKCPVGWIGQGVTRLLKR